jgi:surface protein
MDGMFSSASSFNQDLSAWDVSNVTSMGHMFSYASSFNQDLSAWDVRNVTTMDGMFSSASSFNQDLSAWDVSNVTSMEYMFYNAQNFNQDLSSWDVSNVRNMREMFSNASSFNQDLSSWDVSNVQEYWDFNSNAYQWTLPKPNFNGGGADNSGLVGSWSIASESLALGVGPTQGDISWWSNSWEDVTTRACFFDDTFVFGADGSFANNMGDETWLEGWQGADEGCGAPVYPHDGAATDYTYDYDADAGTITLNGVGAHLGMSKVYNGGELASTSEALGIESITYNVVEISEGGNRMTVDIEFGYGYWTYVLTKN